MNTSPAVQEKVTMEGQDIVDLDEKYAKLEECHIPERKGDDFDCEIYDSKIYC